MNQKKKERLDKIWKESKLVIELLEAARKNNAKKLDEMNEKAKRAGFWNVWYQIAYECREMLDILENADEYDEYMGILCRESDYAFEFYEVEPLYRIGSELRTRELINAETA